MRKITFISDTHNRHEEIEKYLPGGWMLIHAGDCSSIGKKAEINEFLEWFGGLDYDHKILIAGNHDFGFEEYGAHVYNIPPGVAYLQDSSIDIEGVKIYGSPWQPRFHDWAFNLDRGAPLQEKWDKIPTDTDILVTHSPPFGIFDVTPKGDIVGCQDLLDRVVRVQPKIHVFGHIHGGYGLQRRNGTMFVNASSLSEMYKFKNPPLSLDYDELPVNRKMPVIIRNAQKPD